MYFYIQNTRILGSVDSNTSSSNQNKVTIIYNQNQEPASYCVILVVQQPQSLCYLDEAWSKTECRRKLDELIDSSRISKTNTHSGHLHDDIKAQGFVSPNYKI
jgi:hypothetical protein